MHHRIIITAESPLAFPRRKPGAQFTESLPYIPGGVLWGAVGQQLKGTPDARFSNALPAKIGDSWVRVLPATAMSCKSHSGFKASPHPPAPSPNTPHANGRRRGGVRGLPHGVFDTLIDRVCWEALQPAAFTYNPQCPVCLERAKGFGGVYTRNKENRENRENRWQKRSVQHRILTRVAIDRKRSTASETQLYSPIVISEVSASKEENETVYSPTTFMGRVWVMDEKTKNALKKVIAIGARRSSGLGQVTIEVEEEKRSNEISLSKRFTDFNQLFAERWHLFEAHLAPQHDPGWSPNEWNLFTVGLQSHALLLENGWLPTMVFSAAQLKEQTGLDAQLVRSQATYDTIGGWNVSWDRPKPTRLSANSGSLYLFRTQASVDQVIEALQKLEEEGIGQRRPEGYGSVYCCDEFHVLATKEAV